LITSLTTPTGKPLTSPIQFNAALNQPLADQFQIRFTEGFASSFKRRNIALTPNTYDVTPHPQNVPGTVYNTETGFYNPAFPSTNGMNKSGLADFGTRILLRFNNVGVDVRLLLPVVVPLVISGTSTSSTPPQPPPPVPPGLTTGRLTLVLTDPSGLSSPGFTPVNVTLVSEGLAEVKPVGSTAYAVYEVVNSDPSVIESANIPVGVAFISNTAQNLPAPGTTSVNVSFASLSSIATASASRRSSTRHPANSSTTRSTLERRLTRFICSSTAPEFAIAAPLRT
jgi:hypothetical protein